MEDQSRVNYGMEKLKKALDGLEVSVNRLGEDKKRQKTVSSDIDSLNVKNAELETQLADEKAKSVVLQDANNEVSERLETAAENVRDVLRAAV